MTKKEKLLLINDLSARLPYGVHVVHSTSHISGKLNDIHMLHLYHDNEIVQDVICTARFFGDYNVDITYLTPLLRSMSSMTKEEEVEYDATFDTINIDGRYDSVMTYKSYDWLNQHHFDYRGLIEKGLAIEVPKSYYFD